MIDRRMTLMIERLRSLAARKQRFSYDVRGDSHVYEGIIANYNVHVQDVPATDLATVLEHALANDGIVSGLKDAASGRVLFFSCRLYTDLGNAVRFAKEQGGTLVYNWNRGEEVPVGVEPASMVSPGPTTELVLVPLPSRLTA